jgi:excinuclease ABC subunit C
MLEASEKTDYETAAYYRDLLEKFEYIRSNFKTAEKYIENPNLLEDLARESLEQITEKVPLLKKKPERIECYDISNLSGKEAVGSMVVALGGQLEKSEYKKFRIKFKNEPDDYEMMREILLRRFRRFKRGYKKDNWGKPDLVVLDGGKGQVSVGNQVMKEYKLNIPVVGLAKKREELVYRLGDQYQLLRLPQDEEGTKLLMNLRDEAHRFAQNYHHHLRLKKITV